MFRRILDLKSHSNRKSLFLLGPRQVGKTSLLKETFPNAPFYNLLHSDVFLKLSQNPARLREELASSKNAKQSPVIIDEIQKLPLLLDEVQAIIDEQKTKFILTGSSARKLKAKGVNLLGGRASTVHLCPLTSNEIGPFDLRKILNYGSLPSIYLSDHPRQELTDYVGTYLKEEIRAEALVRKIDAFSRFLEVAALSNGELVNFTQVGNDAQVPQRTVVEYFSLLQDTLVGTLLEPLQSKAKTRKTFSASKFYFFDLGVANALLEFPEITPKSPAFGKALECFVFMELKAFAEYHGDLKLNFWRSYAKNEVDFVLNRQIAIEVKASAQISDRHLTGLRAISEEHSLKKKYLVCLEKTERKVGDILIIPLEKFLQKLWADQL